jgi:protoporphyrin/coproporphyrin ferrochelatase
MQSVSKKGILIVNLGTPDSPSTPDVRKYLREFLMDGRVIDFPFIPRWILVNLIIAPFRAPQSAKIYKELWTERGSPLKFHGVSVEEKLQAILGEEYDVKLAMRYQSPSIDAAMSHYQKTGVSEITVIPFFPQYASASTGSVFEKVMKIASTWQVIPPIKITNTFYDHPKFIQAFVEAGKRFMDKNKYDHILFSYHGLPERQIKKGDCTGEKCVLGACCESITPMNQFCYRAQCFATTRLIVKELGLKEGQYDTCFQSRLGRDPWIKPYTDDVIKKLAAAGKKRVLAFSPSFVSDCLETTIEIGEEYKELFEEKGGEHWDLVESLNDKDIWVELLAEMARG